MLLYVWSDLIPVVEGDAVAAVDSQPPFLNHSRTLSLTHRTHSRNHSPFLPNFFLASPGEYVVIIWIFLRLQFVRFLEQAASRAACSPRLRSCLPALPPFAPTFVVLGPVPNRITDIFSPVAAAAAAAASSPSPSSGAARVLSLHSAVFDKCGDIE